MVVKELMGVTTGRGGTVPLSDRVMALWRARDEDELSELVDDGASELVDTTTSELADDGASELVEAASRELVEAASRELVEAASRELVDNTTSELGEDEPVDNKVSEHSDSVSVAADEGIAELSAVVAESSGLPVDRVEIWVAEGRRESADPELVSDAAACRAALSAGPLFQSRRGFLSGPASTAAARDRA